MGASHPSVHQGLIVETAIAYYQHSNLGEEGRGVVKRDE